jgi:hypothetical protein
MLLMLGKEAVVSMRHARRRARAIALKADAAILLDRIIALSALSPVSERMMAEIVEMRLRLAPPPGVKAPIVRTGYSKGPR